MGKANTDLKAGCLEKSGTSLLRTNPELSTLWEANTWTWWLDKAVPSPCLHVEMGQRVCSLGFPCAASGKGSTCQRRRHKRRAFYPWVGKIPWRRAWQPTPVFLPGKSHGQRSLVGYSPWGRKESDMTYHACIHTFITAFPAGVSGSSDSWKLNVITKDLSYLLQRQQHLHRGFLYVWPFEFVLEAWHLLSRFSQALPDPRRSRRQLSYPVSSFEKWDNHWENKKEVLGPSQFWCPLSVTSLYGLTAKG